MRSIQAACSSRPTPQCSQGAGPRHVSLLTSEINTRGKVRAHLEHGLRRALTNEEFFLVYQPQIDISTALPVGVEALLRWRDPEAPELSGPAGLRAAEECGLIHPLGAWVLQTACAQAPQ